MKTAGWLGIALWGIALVVSYHSGRSQGDLPEESAEYSEDRSISQVTPSSVTRSSEDFIADFEGLLPERGDMENHDALWLLAGDWAAQDPEAAVTWLNQLEFDDVRNPYLFSALSQWASADPAQARAWLEKNGPAAGESLLYQKAALIRGMARRDPSAALEYLLAQPKSLGRSTVDFVLGAEAREGSTALFSFLNSLPSERPDLRLEAMKKGAAQLSQDMIPAAREFSDTLADPQERLAFRDSLINRWALTDPQEALAWAADLPDSQERARVLSTAAKQWARQQPLAASEWLSERRGTPEYDLSARSVAWSVVGLDPDLAFSQVGVMQSASLRRETFEQLGRFWISDQPQVAEAFLRGENPLPADIRASLLSHFQ